MPSIKIINDSIILELRKLEILFAFKRRLKIPIKHIQDIILDFEEIKRSLKLRILGMSIPEKMYYGTFITTFGKAFLAINNPRKIIGLILKGFKYRLVAFSFENDKILERILEIIARS